MCNRNLKSVQIFSSGNRGGFKDALIGVYLGLTEYALYAKDLTWHFVDILVSSILCIH